MKEIIGAIVGGIVSFIFVASLGFIFIVSLIVYWQFFLTIAVIVGVIYVFYEWSGAGAEHRRQKALSRRQEALTRAQEIQKSTQDLKDDVQLIVEEARHPDWDRQQGGKALSTVFSDSADSAILLGELIAGAVTETWKNSGKTDSGSI